MRVARGEPPQARFKTHGLRTAEARRVSFVGLGYYPLRVKNKFSEVLKMKKKSKEFFTEKNVKRTMFDATPTITRNIGEVAILKPAYVKTFPPEYRTAEYQLFRLKSGFGCQPHTLGNGCFGHFCMDGEECRMERYDFVGIADEATAAYAAELESKWQKPNKKAV